MYGGDGGDGSNGADCMSGGKGSDAYIVHYPGDVIDDQGDPADLDYVYIPVYLNYDLPEGFTGVVLQGTANSSVVGNAGNNVVFGNEGNNQLTGGDGDDTVNGGGGTDVLIGGNGAGGIGAADVFRVDTALNGSTNVNTIIDFTPTERDRIQLENTGIGVFNAITTTGTLALAAFVTGTAFTTAQQRIRHDGETDADQRLCRRDRGSGHWRDEAPGPGTQAAAMTARESCPAPA